MEYTGGAKYQGSVAFGRFEGEGKFNFTDGSYYVGGFKNGQFHGEGVIYMSIGKYTGKWENGKKVEGKLTFKDGLDYEEDWKYCCESDRRFHSEMNPLGRGILPAGELAYRDKVKTLQCPSGCYDTGDGYFDPVIGSINCSNEVLKTTEERIPDQDEIDWIQQKAFRAP